MIDLQKVGVKEIIRHARWIQSQPSSYHHRHTTTRTYNDRFLHRILPIDSNLRFEFSPSPLGNFKGRLREFARRLRKTRMQMKDAFLHDTAQVFVVWSTNIQGPFVGLIVVSLFSQVDGQAAIDNGQVGSGVGEASG